MGWHALAVFFPVMAREEQMYKIGGRWAKTRFPGEDSCHAFSLYHPALLTQFRD